MKSENSVGKTSYGAVRGKIRPMCLLHAGNDTVPISMWRGGAVRSTDCPLVVVVKMHNIIYMYDPLLYTPDTMVKTEP